MGTSIALTLRFLMLVASEVAINYVINVGSKYFSGDMSWSRMLILNLYFIPVYYAGSVVMQYVNSYLLQIHANPWIINTFLWGSIFIGSAIALMLAFGQWPASWKDYLAIGLVIAGVSLYICR